MKTKMKRIDKIVVFDNKDLRPTQNNPIAIGKKPYNNSWSIRTPILGINNGPNAEITRICGVKRSK